MRDFANRETYMSATPQEVYDAFNTLMFSADRKVLGKLLAKHWAVQATWDVPGDIVEAGVFKGSGVAAWLKILGILGASNKSVVGFDFFDVENMLSSTTGKDREGLRELFSSRAYSPQGACVAGVTESICRSGFSERHFELIAGDVRETAAAFCDQRPGFRASVLYIDVDVADATEAVLRAMWPRVSPGGLVILDDYAVHQWSEANGADAFVNSLATPVRIKSLPFACPTAYVQKV